MSQHGLSCSDRALRNFIHYDFLLGEDPGVSVVPCGQVPPDVRSFVAACLGRRVSVACCREELAARLEVRMSYGAVWRLYHEHQRCALHGAGSGPVRSLEPCSGKKCLDLGGLLELGGSLWGLVEERGNELL